MFWYLLIVLGCVACFFTMIFFLRKAYLENINSLGRYNFSSTNSKVMLPFLLGMNLPNWLYYSEGGIKKWFSIIVLIIFLTSFLIIVFSNQNKVKRNENKV